MDGSMAIIGEVAGLQTSALQQLRTAAGTMRERAFLASVDARTTDERVPSMRSCSGLSNLVSQAAERVLQSRIRNQGT